MTKKNRDVWIKVDRLLTGLTAQKKDGIQIKHLYYELKLCSYLIIFPT